MDEATIEAYEKLHPEVDIELLILSTDDLKKNLKVAAASQTLPNFWFNWGGSLGSFYPENGLTVDFTPIAEERGWDEIFTESAIEMCTLDGQLAGVPTQLSSFSFIYYKPIMEQVGWSEPPTTFEEFEQMLADIKAQGITPLAMGGKYGWHVMRFIEYLIEMYCGPEGHDQMTMMTTSWDNEGLVKALEKFKEYCDKGYFPEGFITAEPNDSRMLLYSGTAAMTVGGASEVAAIKTEGFDINEFGTFNFPGTDGHSRVTTLPNMFQVNIANTPEEIETCIDYALFYTSSENEETIGDKFTPVGARIGHTPADSLVADIQQQQLDYGGFTILDQGLPQEVINQWFIVQDSIENGSMTPDQAGSFMDEQIAAYKASLG